MTTYDDDMELVDSMQNAIAGTDAEGAADDIVQALVAGSLAANQSPTEYVEMLEHIVGMLSAEITAAKS